VNKIKKNNMKFIINYRFNFKN